MQWIQLTRRRVVRSHYYNGRFCACLHFVFTYQSNKPKRSKRQSVISSKSGRIMSLLLIVGVAAFASFMYNVPIMQKVEIKSLQESLNRNVYCQQHAVDELMRHIRQYTAMEWKGLVLLVLAGPEGCGKTHTINTMAEVNPSWTKIVVTHEQGYLNKLGEEEFISNIRRKIHSSRLNFIFVDDAQPLREGTPFVEMKLKPLLASLKLENTLIFVVVTMLSKDDKVSMPTFLTDEFECRIIPYEGLNRTCVERCVLDVIMALDHHPHQDDFEGLMRRFDFEDNGRDQKVSVNGCKSVPIKVALYLEGDPPIYNDSEGDRTLS
ncbi:uncharacterized protein LOC111247208 isoform X2 [Varroa destructor]|uniref:AAA+ ATPase domain-containing protein n=1 Tax=Varroa destructor TaxID=109461 RepID=A0A7M7JKJ8_VARDE|nr:uncharacterized protein LOC111247208 isoform X2 [Varroa destructor]XP_022653626.1 uncharacterized protein LOC111247208 isoform X2 [Varroa destructor]